MERLYFFLAEHDEIVAQAAIRAIRDHVALLEKFPNAGRITADMAPGDRELLIPYGASGYVILYHLESKVVSILAIRHQKETGY